MINFSFVSVTEMRDELALLGFRFVGVVHVTEIAAKPLTPCAELTIPAKSAEDQCVDPPPKPTRTRTKKVVDPPLADQLMAAVVKTDVVEPVAQAVEPVAQAAVEPVAQAAVEPVAQAAVEPVAQAAVEPVAQAAVAQAAVDKVAVRAACVAARARIGTAKPVLAVLGQYGTTTVDEIPADKLAEVLSKVEALQAESQ